MPPQNFLTLEGARALRPHSLMSLCGADEDEALGRWSFRPPKFVRKTFRYTGAALASPFMKAGAAKKAFGLSSRESKQFETAAKATRGVLAAGAAVLTAYGAASYFSAGASKVGAGTVLKLGKTGAKSPGFWSNLFNKGGSFLVKKASSDELWKIGTSTAGAMIGQRYHSSQIPQEDYAALPNNTPVPIAADPESAVRPSFVAGSGGMTPQEESDNEPDLNGRPPSEPNPEWSMDKTMEAQELAPEPGDQGPDFFSNREEVSQAVPEEPAPDELGTALDILRARQRQYYRRARPMGRKWFS